VHEGNPTNLARIDIRKINEQTEIKKENDEQGTYESRNLTRGLCTRSECGGEAQRTWTRTWKEAGRRDYEKDLGRRCSFPSSRARLQAVS
jgi:hypothetical protein